VLNAVYSCLTQKHDLRLVALALLICVLASFTAISLFLRARETLGKRSLVLLSGAAAVFGAGGWATHFVAELAYRPGLPVAYDTGPTILSLVIAVAVAWFGMIVAVRRQNPLIGGGIIGLAIGAMHFAGMAALRVPADVHWNSSFVAASLVLGVVLSAAAISAARLGSARLHRLSATMLLVAAICGLHFTAMAAIGLTPDPLIAMPADVVAPQLLAVPVAAIALAVVMLGMSASIIEEQRSRQEAREAEQLRRSKDHLARAQRVAATGSFELDLRSHEIEWSEETYRIFGASPQIGPLDLASLEDMIIPEDRPRLREQIAVFVAGGPQPALEYRIRRADGGVRVLHREMELVRDGAGQPHKLVGVIRDVTELREAERRSDELERQLMHSQKLEALGTLAGGVAHDLNNILVPILALAKLTLEDLREGDPMRRDLETVVRASERARDLVKQVLAFSRKQDFVREEVDLAALTREALNMLRASLPATIRIDEQVAAVPPVFGDAGELHQAIVNLVTNAGQAIGGGPGKITVRVWPPPSAAQAASVEPAVCLSVADTGCGIEEATLGRIFEPFFTTKGVGEGTGLGLSVVHGIVARHGGHIEIRSRPGEGSEFLITLPALGQLHTTTPIASAAA
jgi:PAS domain S-box-containing protein